MSVDRVGDKAPSKFDTKQIENLLHQIQEHEMPGMKPDRQEINSIANEADSLNSKLHSEHVLRNNLNFKGVVMEGVQDPEKGIMMQPFMLVEDPNNQKLAYSVDSQTGEIRTVYNVTTDKNGNQKFDVAPAATGEGDGPRATELLPPEVEAALVQHTNKFENAAMMKNEPAPKATDTENHKEAPHPARKAAHPRPTVKETPVPVATATAQ